MGLSKSLIAYLTRICNIVVGCNHGCPKCWARERWAPRMKCPLCRAYTPHIHAERWGDVTPRQKPAIIGIGFFADLFGDWDWLYQAGHQTTSTLATMIGERITACPQHTFVTTTRRPDRIPACCNLPNWWIGATVTGELESADRIDRLLWAPVAHRWLSYEPALRPLDIAPFIWRAGRKCRACGLTYGHDAAIGGTGCQGLKWVVAGGQSGPGRAPCDVDWIRRVRDECIEAGVPFFYKQGPGDHGSEFRHMPLLDGRTWAQVPDAFEPILKAKKEARG